MEEIIQAPSELSLTQQMEWYALRNSLQKLHYYTKQDMVMNMWVILKAKEEQIKVDYGIKNGFLPVETRPRFDETAVGDPRDLPLELQFTYRAYQNDVARMSCQQLTQFYLELWTGLKMREKAHYELVGRAIDC